MPSPEEWSLPLMGLVAGSYRYLADLLYLESCTAGTTPYSWPRGPSPLSVEAFARYLRSYPDKQFVSYILQGLSSGFRIGFSHSSHRLRTRGRNHPSSLANATVVSDQIQLELQAGRLVGPLSQAAVTQVHVSPIGLVPKGHDTGRWRMIVDLSSPNPNSVNDGIQEDRCSLHYASMDDALQLICSLGPGCLLLKMDLKDAYRVVPIHPGDQHLLGISWKGCVYIDRSLPFGLRSAPKLFTAVADAMAWALFSRGIKYVLHYLDDFLFVTPPQEAVSVRRVAEATFEELGVPVATHKTEGPGTQVTFLGFLLDTDAFQLRLPEEKLKRMRELVDGWRTRQSCTRRELESLLGSLSHAAVAVRPGRLFLRQLFGLLSAVSRPFHYIRLNLATRADLAWWAFFLQEWNGVSLLQYRHPLVHVFSDASGSFGCGAVVPNGAWFNQEWPSCWSEKDISAKELIPIVLAAALWGPHWPGKQVLFHTDNLAVVQVIKNMNAANQLLCNLLRCLYFYAAHYRFTFTAEHIPGVKNVAADALSRDNLPLFHSLFPQVPRHTIPHTLAQLLLLQIPDWNSGSWMSQFRGSLLPDFPRRQ